MDNVKFAGGTGAYTGRPDRFAKYCFFVHKFSSVEELIVINDKSKKRNTEILKKLKEELVQLKDKL